MADLYGLFNAKYKSNAHPDSGRVYVQCDEPGCNASEPKRVVSFTEKFSYCWECGERYGGDDFWEELIGVAEEKVPVDVEIASFLDNFVYKPEEKPLPKVQLPSGSFKVRLDPYLSSRGIGPERLRTMPVYSTPDEGRWYQRVIFPIFEPLRKRMVGYVGRACYGPDPKLSDVEKWAWEKETGYRKVLNSTGFSSQKMVWGLEKFSKDEGKTFAVVCEGIFDASSFDDYGVALLGKVISTDKIKAMLKAGIETAVIMLDAGEEATAFKIAVEMNKAGILTRVAVCPRGYKDPNEAPKHKLIEAINNSRMPHYYPKEIRKRLHDRVKKHRKCAWSWYPGHGRTLPKLFTDKERQDFNYCVYGESKGKWCRSTFLHKPDANSTFIANYLYLNKTQEDYVNAFRELKKSEESDTIHKPP